MKQAILASVQVPKGLGCQAGNKAKAQNLGRGPQTRAKGKPELRCCAAARSPVRPSLTCLALPVLVAGRIFDYVLVVKCELLVASSGI